MKIVNRLTFYICKSITEYTFYNDYYDIIKTNRYGNPLYINSRNTPSYFLVTMFKVYGMKIAKIICPWDVSHFVWVDFGASHIARDFRNSMTALCNKPHPKISFCYIHYRSHQELDLDGSFAAGGLTGIAATVFSVPVDFVDKFYLGCMSIFHELLFHKLGHHEEQIFTYFYDRYPYLCKVYYGDYYSCIQNYHCIVADFDSIHTFFIKNVMLDNRKDLLYDAVNSVLYSIREGFLTISQENIKILQSYLIKYTKD